MDATAGASYGEAFLSPQSTEIMRKGGILPPGINGRGLLEAVRRAVEDTGSRYTSARSSRDLAARLVGHIEHGRCVLGTPALTNIARGNRPVASCAAVPLIPDTDSVLPSLSTSEEYYTQNMGSGYNLHRFSDPVRELLRLNEHAATVQNSDRCERYVGNMALVGADHPRVHEFIDAKTARSLPHFNISVDFSEPMIDGLARQGTAADVLGHAAEAAWRCGDPGVLSLDRFNRSNALADQHPYLTTAPCAEVGLAEGDTCVFGYINLSAFLVGDSMTDYNWELLADVVDTLALSLDGLLDLGADRLPTKVSRDLTNLKRRIGICVCGFADLLLWLNIEYGTQESLDLLRSLLAFVQFTARAASVRLAKERGPFPGFWLSRWRTGDLETAVEDSTMVAAADWTLLSEHIRTHGLRNAVSTAAPPSGRSSLLIGAFPSIEPPLADPATVSLNTSLRRRVADMAAGHPVRRSATEIPWQRHLAVVEVTNRHVDEGVSKTINLATAATADDVLDIYRTALVRGLRAISVYRSGSRPPA